MEFFWHAWNSSCWELVLGTFPCVCDTGRVGWLREIRTVNVYSRPPSTRQRFEAGAKNRPSDRILTLVFLLSLYFVSQSALYQTQPLPETSIGFLLLPRPWRMQHNIRSNIANYRSILASTKICTEKCRLRNFFIIRWMTVIVPLMGRFFVQGQFHILSPIPDRLNIHIFSSQPQHFQSLSMLNMLN